MTLSVDTWNRLQELIDQGNLDTIISGVPVTPKIYVPQGIGLTPPIPESIPAGIVNYEHQELTSDHPNYDTYFVYRSTSNNTGSNYYLKEVKEPQPGKIYFVTDRDEIFPFELNTLFNYKLYLTPNDYCMWDIIESKGVERNNHTWDHYYEVCYESKD